jgi:hypothetical protein
MIALMLAIMIAVTPTVTSVIMNDGTEISVVQSEELSVPTEDDVFGYIDQYPQPLFVAHRYLAGDHVMRMMKGGSIIVKYSDGTEEKFRISGYMDLGFDTQAERQYIDEGCIYFQTCNGTGIRAIVACKID